MTGEWYPQVILGGSAPVRVWGAVFQTVGAASLAWREAPSGVFDTGRAIDIADGLLTWLRDNFEDVRTWYEEMLAEADQEDEENSDG